MLLNHLRFPECRRNATERQYWLEHVKANLKGDPLGSDAHLVEFFAELKWQLFVRKKKKKKKKDEKRTKKERKNKRKNNEKILLTFFFFGFA